MELIKRSFTLFKWNGLCKPIEEGELRIRKSKENNIVFLARTFITNENFLYTENMKAKYCPNKYLWEAKFNSENS